MNDFFDNQRILTLIWKWRKHLVVVGAVAAGAAALFSSSLFIQPKFRSTARVYPTHNIYTLSDESETEQLLEIMSSQDIKLRVFDAFNLGEVYRIRKDDPHYLTYMLSEFNDNVSMKKTEFETVEIKVLDTDPQRASDICDSLIVFSNDKIWELHRAKFMEVVLSTQKIMGKLNHEIDSLAGKMNAIRKDYKILDYESQAKEVTKGYMKALAEQRQNTAGGQKIEKMLDNLAEKGGEYDRLSVEMKYLLQQKDSVKRTYDWSLNDASNEITFCQTVQKPVPADKKAYPVRWLIVLVTTLSSLFVALLLILIIENKKSA